MSNKTLLALCVAMAMLAGCKPKETETPVAEATPPPAAETPAATETTAATPPAAPDADAAAAPATVAFDIGTIPVSDQPLPAWPYIALPAGYHYDQAWNLAGKSKDLARGAVWTGGALLWLEGRTFSDEIRSDDGKTYSKFEVRKNLQQAIEALGGVRLAERSYDEATYMANEAALSDFRQEFSHIRDAYWYDRDADTWVIRRDDKAVWVVFHSGNDHGALMVVEGPLPEAPAE